MDANHANRDRGRMTIAEMWRPLPWWERVVYVLTVLLFLLAFLVGILTDHLPDNLSVEMYATLNRRLPDIDTLLSVACFPFLVASCALAVRRWQPDVWPVFRRLWSVRAMLVGVSVLFAIIAWSCVIDLATPLNQIPPSLPSVVAVPAFAAGGVLALVGMLLAVPEVIVRKSRTKRRH